MDMPGWRNALQKPVVFSKLFTLQTSVRQKEKLTVMLAHSLQIVHVNRRPEVKPSVKQTQAIISKVAYSHIYVSFA